MSPDALIDEFYRVCYSNRHNLQTVEKPNTPQEMIVDEISSGWIRWKLLARSKEIDPAFAELEKEIGHKLPESFKLWHSRCFTLDGDVGLVRLPAIPFNDPFGPLRGEMVDGWLPKNIADKGFISFASDGNDGGPLCFNTNTGVEDADYPIYLWNHNWAGTDREIRVMFSSFRKLLECCVHYTGGTLTDYGVLPKGSKGFSLIDPPGAGKYFGFEL